jgi:hypothetical protein
MMVKNIIKDVHFSWTDYQFSWAMDEVIAKLNPVIIDEKIVLSLTGKFPPFETKLGNGSLYPITPDSGCLKLIPLNEDTFMLTGVDDLRIKIKMENRCV